MLVKLSEDIQREVETTIRSRLGSASIVDVYAAAEDIRRRHAADETALEDIAASIVRLAAQSGCTVEFGGRPQVARERQSD